MLYKLKTEKDIEPIELYKEIEKSFIHKLEKEN